MTHVSNFIQANFIALKNRYRKVLLNTHRFTTIKAKYKTFK